MGQVNCFSTTNELYAALRKDYVDAIAGHEAMLGSLVRDGEDAYRMLDESIYTSELGIAFKKGTHEEVAQELTETLEEMRNEGITEEIVKKYGLDADEILPGGKANEQTGKNADAADAEKDKKSKSKGKKFDKNACLLMFILLFSGILIFLLLTASDNKN